MEEAAGVPMFRRLPPEPGLNGDKIEDTFEWTEANSLTQAEVANLSIWVAKQQHDYKKDGEPGVREDDPTNDCFHTSDL